MRVDAQRGRCALLGQSSEGRDGNLHVIPDASGFEDNLVGMFFENGAAEVGNHEWVCTIVA